MDTDTLVENRIDDGLKLVAQLTHNGFDVTAACWVKTSEEGRWFLYIASKAVDEKGAAAAYREVYRVLQSMPEPWVSMSDVKLIGAANPIAKDVLAIQHRYEEHTIPIFIRLPQLGGMAIEQACIYPPLESAFKDFDRIKQHFPTAEIFSMTVPFREPGVSSMLQALSPYQGAVNNSEFEGRAAGTLLFMGPQVSSAKSMAKLVFIYRPEGWNKLFRAETNSWEEVVDASTGEKPYPSADFRPLAAMKATSDRP